MLGDFILFLNLDMWKLFMKIWLWYFYFLRVGEGGELFVGIFIGFDGFKIYFWFVN